MEKMSHFCTISSYSSYLIIHSCMPVKVIKGHKSDDNQHKTKRSPTSFNLIYSKLPLTVIPCPISQGQGIISGVVYLNLKSFRTDILLYF